MFSGPVVKRITIRTLARTVKCLVQREVSQFSFGRRARMPATPPVTTSPSGSVSLIVTGVAAALIALIYLILI